MTRSETRTDNGQLILRARLGRELRRLREREGISLLAAAKHAGISESTLSRIETGNQATLVAYVRTLTTLYKAADSADDLADLAERGAALGWWNAYGADKWFQALLAREAIASRIDTHETELIPGLLQTEGYIRATRAAAVPDAPEKETNGQVEFRLSRQQHLGDGGMPALTFVLGESVLARPVGDPVTWRGQITRLIDAATSGVSLHILPFTAGAHPAMGVPFSVVTVTEGPDLDAVYLEDDRSGRERRAPADLRRYRAIFERLTSMSMSVEHSVAYLSRLARNA